MDNPKIYNLLKKSALATELRDTKLANSKFRRMT
jgi:hypothetical protein